jgi:hypothetical protein
MLKQERWLVDKEGYTLVQEVEQVGGVDAAAPWFVEHGGRMYRFDDLCDGVQIYVEAEDFPP